MVDACRWFAMLLLRALRGADKEEILGPALTQDEKEAFAEWQLAPGVAGVAAGSFLAKEPPVIVGTGYVIRSLEAALWAFRRGSTYRDGALLAVNLGDDADTTGAIYGQLAGAHYGVEAISQRWLSRLARHDLVVSFADSLFELRSELARIRDRR